MVNKTDRQGDAFAEVDLTPEPKNVANDVDAFAGVDLAPPQVTVPGADPFAGVDLGFGGELRDSTIPPIQPQEETGITDVLTSSIPRGFANLTQIPTGLRIAFNDWQGDDNERDTLVAKYLQRQSEIDSAYPKNAPNLAEAKFGENMLLWAADIIGENVSTLAGFATGAGLGSLIAKKVATKAISKELGKFMLRKGIQKDITTAAARLSGKAAGRGGIAGGFAFGEALSTNELIGEQVLNDLEISGETAFLASIPRAALDVIPLVSLSRGFGLGKTVENSILQGITKIPNRVKRAGALAAYVGVSESGTEALQEVIAIAARKVVDENYDVLGKEARERLLEAGAGGLVAGTAFAGAGGLATPDRSESNLDELPELAVPPPVREEAAAAEEAEATTAEILEQVDEVTPVIDPNAPLVDEFDPSERLAADLAGAQSPAQKAIITLDSVLDTALDVQNDVAVPQEIITSVAEVSQRLTNLIQNPATTQEDYQVAVRETLAELEYWTKESTFDAETGGLLIGLRDTFRALTTSTLTAPPVEGIEVAEETISEQDRQLIEDTLIDQAEFAQLAPEQRRVKIDRIIQDEVSREVRESTLPDNFPPDPTARNTVVDVEEAQFGEALLDTTTVKDREGAEAVARDVFKKQQVASLNFAQPLDIAIRNTETALRSREEAFRLTRTTEPRRALHKARINQHKRLLKEQKRMRKTLVKLEQGAVELVEGIAKRFLPGTKVLIKDARSLLAAPGTDLKVESGGLGNSWNAANGLSVISINPGKFIKGSKIDKVGLSQNIYHEMGHSIIAHEFRKASLDIQNAVMAEYTRWLEQARETSLQSFYQTQVSPARGASTLARHQREGVDLSTFTVEEGAEASQRFSLARGESPDVAAFNASYTVSFDEYLAENFVRYMTSKDRGPVANFFRRVGAILQRYYRLVQHNFPVPKTFEAFVEDVLLRNSEVVPVPSEITASKNIQKSLDETMKGLKKTEQLDPDTIQNVKTDPAKFGKFLKLALALTQIEQMNAHIPGVSRYVEGTRQWWTNKTKWIDRAKQRLDAWDSTPQGKDVEDRFNRALFEMTLKSEEVNRKLSAKEQLDIFRKYRLAERTDLHEIFNGTQEDFAQALNALEATMIADTNKRFVNQETDRVAALRKLKRDFATLRNKTYFPLSRFGQYWVLVRARKPVDKFGTKFAAGDTILFETFTTLKDMRKGKIRLAREFKGQMVSGGKLSEEAYAVSGMPHMIIQMVQDTLDLSTSQVRELKFLEQELAPGQSYKKALLKRKGTLGFSLNAKRSYAHYFMRFSNYISRIEASSELIAAQEDLRNYIKQLQNTPDAESVNETLILEHFQKHFKYAMNPGNEWANIRSIGFLWYLGFVPKSAVVNLTQIPLVTFPYLSKRYGTAATVKELTKAMKDLPKAWLRGTGMAQELETAIERGIEAGILDESLATELAAQAEGNNLFRTIPGTFAESEKASKALRTASHYGAWMFQKAEKLNRLQAFVASYRLAQKKLLDGKQYTQLTPEDKALVDEQSYKSARLAVESTQFEYARWNRPEFMRGRKSIVFLFMNYLQNALFFAAHDQARLRFMFMMLVMGGLSGLPFAEDLMDVVNYAMTKMKERLGWENPKVDVRLAIRDFANGINLNPDTLMHGVSSQSFGLHQLGDMVGLPIPKVDISGSLSMGRILPGVQPIFGTEEDYARSFGRATENIAGAAIAVPLGLIRAVASDDPDTFKVWERAMPTALKSILRAGRFTTRGEETGSAGGRIAEFNIYDTDQRAEIIAQGLGFRPTRLAKEQELRWLQRQHVTYYQTRRAIILKDFDYAMKTKDREAIADAKRALRMYNKSVPSGSLKIRPEDLLSSRKRRAKSRVLESHGKNTSRKNLPILRDVERRFRGDGS